MAAGFVPRLQLPASERIPSFCRFSLPITLLASLDLPAKTRDRQVRHPSRLSLGCRRPASRQGKSRGIECLSVAWQPDCHSTATRESREGESASVDPSMCINRSSDSSEEIRSTRLPEFASRVCPTRDLDPRSQLIRQHSGADLASSFLSSFPLLPPTHSPFFPLLSSREAREIESTSCRDHRIPSACLSVRGWSLIAIAFFPCLSSRLVPSSEIERLSVLLPSVKPPTIPVGCPFAGSRVSVANRILFSCIAYAVMLCRCLRDASQAIFSSDS